MQGHMLSRAAGIVTLSRAAGIVAAVLAVAVPAVRWPADGLAAGPSGSIYGPPGAQPPMTLQQGAWTYIDPPPVREFHLHDIITVVVNLDTRAFSEGEVQQRKQSNIDAVLADWLQLRGLNLKPAPMSDGDLRVNAKLNSQMRADSEFDSREGMILTIAAEVVGILPNGNLVLEAHREVQLTEGNVWRQSLMGIVRPDDVLPNNSVRSEHVAHLRIKKEESGRVVDGYKRGWLLKFIERVTPF